MTVPLCRITYVICLLATLPLTLVGAQQTTIIIGSPPVGAALPRTSGEDSSNERI